MARPTQAMTLDQARRLKHKMLRAQGGTVTVPSRLRQSSRPNAYDLAAYRSALDDLYHLEAQLEDAVQNDYRERVDRLFAEVEEARDLIDAMRRRMGTTRYAMPAFQQGADKNKSSNICHGMPASTPPTRIRFGGATYALVVDKADIPVAEIQIWRKRTGSGSGEYLYVCRLTQLDGQPSAGQYGGAAKFSGVGKDATGALADMASQWRRSGFLE